MSATEKTESMIQSAIGHLDKHRLTTMGPEPEDITETFLEDYWESLQRLRSHDALVEALEAWMEFNRETKEENPCPDYAYRARLRMKAKSLTEAALAHLLERGEG